jgi:hypothetical protein
VLAKIVGENNPAEAANMLDVYQTQRIADTGNYNYALGQQHDFAQQQLHQQLLENYMKYGQEALKTPGGATLLGAQTGGAALAGFDPTQIETNLRMAQAASTAKDIGTAAYQGLEGGLATDPALATTASGGLFSGSTVPLALQKEAMVQAGHNARAGAAAAAAGLPSVSLAFGPQEQFGGASPTLSNSGKHGGLPVLLNAANSWGLKLPTAVPLPTDTSRSGTPAPSNAAPAIPPQGGKGAVAPPAPSGGSRVQASASGGGNAQAFANKYVENNLRISNPAAYRDVMSNAKNGNVTVVQGADGRLHLQGKQGQY